MRPVLVDGFLLYQNPTNRERLDVRLFLDSATMSPRSDDSTDPDTDLKHEFWKTEDHFERMV
jgi:uridine kinase